MSYYGNRYASREGVWGECPRSGIRIELDRMVPDGHVKGLMVHPDWYDPPHPQEKLGPVFDPETVKNPSPELSQPLTNITFPGFELTTGNVYGGMLESVSLGQVSVSVVASSLELFTTDTGGWLEDDQGNNIGFNP